MDEKVYSSAIIGGGVAGLCLSIELARKGFSVVLFEKHSYPFHKVCGEYVSNESRRYFERLGLPLDELKLPEIKSFGISSRKGFMLNALLPLGGFGISRYRLDQELYRLALKNGVTIHENTRVSGVSENEITTNKGNFKASVIVGAFGKSDPIFAKHKSDRSRERNNYVGVKYHINTDFPANRIELHNFSSGYCGISKIEDDKYCLCYISQADALKACGNSLSELEEKVLKKNRFLKHIFNNSQIITGPVTVSNIRFSARRAYDKKMLYAGDSAGCTSPLTGNGMSMAAYSAHVLSSIIEQFLERKISLKQMQLSYEREWQQTFGSRISRGNLLQQLFRKKHLGDLVLRSIAPFEPLKAMIIRSTHGRPF